MKMKDPSVCPHENFAASVCVNKIEDANVLSVDLKITCDECGARLVFTGMQGGLSYEEPRVSPFGLEARLPAKLIGPEDNRSAEVGQYKLEEH